MLLYGETTVSDEINAQELSKNYLMTEKVTETKTAQTQNQISRCRSFNIKESELPSNSRSSQFQAPQTPQSLNRKIYKAAYASVFPNSQEIIRDDEDIKISGKTYVLMKTLM